MYSPRPHSKTIVRPLLMIIGLALVGVMIWFLTRQAHAAIERELMQRYEIVNSSFVELISDEANAAVVESELMQEHDDIVNPDYSEPIPDVAYAVAAVESELIHPNDVNSGHDEIVNPGQNEIVNDEVVNPGHDENVYAGHDEIVNPVNEIPENVNSDYIKIIPDVKDAADVERELMQRHDEIVKWSFDELMSDLYQSDSFEVDPSQYSGINIVVSTGPRITTQYFPILLNSFLKDPNHKKMRLIVVNINRNNMENQDFPLLSEIRTKFPSLEIHNADAKDVRVAKLSVLNHSDYATPEAYEEAVRVAQKYVWQTYLVNDYKASLDIGLTPLQGMEPKYIIRIEDDIQFSSDNYNKFDVFVRPALDQKDTDFVKLWQTDASGNRYDPYTILDELSVDECGTIGIAFSAASAAKWSRRLEKLVDIRLNSSHREYQDGILHTYPIDTILMRLGQTGRDLFPTVFDDVDDSQKMKRIVPSLYQHWGRESSSGLYNNLAYAHDFAFLN